MINFRCPECMKTFAVKDIYAGKKARCKCGAVIRVPSVSEQLRVTEPKFDKQSPVSEDPKNLQTSSTIKEPPAIGVQAKPTSVPEESPKAAEKDDPDSEASTAKTKKNFRGLGWTVIILGLMSLLFIGDASDELLVVTFAGIGFCVVTGAWLAIVPSVPIGVAAGASLAILGIIDITLVTESGGLGFIAPLIDFGFAIKVFIGCSSYAKVLAETEPAEQ